MGTRYAVLNAVATGKGREVKVLGNKKLRTFLQKNVQRSGELKACVKMKGETATTGVRSDEILKKGMNIRVRILAVSISRGLIVADDAEDVHITHGRGKEGRKQE